MVCSLWRLYLGVHVQRMLETSIGKILGKNLLKTGDHIYDHNLKSQLFRTIIFFC